jgi:hypothetical protein
MMVCYFAWIRRISGYKHVITCFYNLNYKIAFHLRILCLGFDLLKAIMFHGTTYPNNI